MTLVDADSVDVSNLHRQVIHKEATAGQLKVQSAIAASRLLSQVPACEAALWSSLSSLPVQSRLSTLAPRSLGYQRCSLA